MTDDEYKRLTRPHRRAVRKLLMDLEFFVEDMGSLSVFSIESRIKTLASALRKAHQQNIPIEQLQDLAGIRIVVSTQQEVEATRRFLYRQQDSKDLEVESDKRAHREDGYSSRHIVVIIQPHYSRSMHPARVEVQISTVFEHAFNFLSRVWCYKSPALMPDPWMKSFLSLADDLEALDGRANQLHTEVLDSAHLLESHSALTPMSLQRIVEKEFREHISLQEAVDSCRFLVDLGCTTNGAVREFFRDPRIADLREKMLTSDVSVAVSWREIVEKMSLHSFWLMFGVRYDHMVGLLEQERK